MQLAVMYIFLFARFVLGDGLNNEFGIRNNLIQD